MTEITDIIKDRLLSLDEDSPTKKGFLDQNAKGKVPLMHPMAVELAARKIAGAGDLRKALDVCRQAIELVESEMSTKSKQGDENAKNMLEKPIESLDEVPKVTVKHILAATNAMLGSPVVLRIRSLQMHAKLVLCTIVVMSKKTGFLMSIGNIHESYLNICKNNNNQAFAVENTEFKDLIGMLEVQGFIMITSKKPKEDYKNKTVSLNISTDDVEKAVSGSPLLESVLEKGVSALNKK